MVTLTNGLQMGLQMVVSDQCMLSTIPYLQYILQFF